VSKTPMQVDTEALKEKARRFRLDVLDMTTKYGGHLSSCYSATEIMTAVYFGGILRYRSDEPHWPERDRFIVSKGHAAPLLYAVLAEAGYFGHEDLGRFRQIGSPFHGHPVQDSVPGVEITSGSLGQGLSFGLGHVLSGWLSTLDYRVYVLLGDGECEEGQIWEAAMSAARFKADKLTAIVDYNKYQQNGPIRREMALEPFVEKWQAFGWHIEEVDGHDLEALVEALNAVQGVVGQPQVIIAHTVKGKGISFVESDYTYHGRGIASDMVAQAREEILCS
jgi:transketolase